MRIKLIGMVGAAGSGKDTASDALCQGTIFRKDSFAAPLYEGLATMLGCTVDTLQDRKQKERGWPGLGKSPRQMLQTLGTEWGRDLVHPHIWVRLADARHASRLRLGVGTVMSDVRFENEAAWVRAQGGILVRITRPGTAQVADHISERQGDGIDVDYTFANTEGKVELERAVATMLGHQ